MNGGQFVAWVQGIAASQIGRRPILHALVGGPLAGFAATLALPAAAKRRKKRKKKKVKLNAFGCVDVGKFCKTGAQCCSGICQGKKDKKTCQAHDQSTCQPGQDICLGIEVDCTTTAGDAGVCTTTTGQASYCQATGGDCFPCAKDADCVPFCGAGAACIDCPTCDLQGFQTGCVGLSFDSCEFP